MYDRGKALLGKSAGGQITKLKTALGVGRALEVIDLARRKENPREYVAGVIRSNGHDPEEPDFTSPEFRSWAAGVFVENGDWNPKWGDAPTAEEIVAYHAERAGEGNPPKAQAPKPRDDLTADLPPYLKAAGGQK